MKSSLIVHPFRIWFRLGCTEAERVHPQAVDISVHIKFDTPPKGAHSDILDDTIDYCQFIHCANNLAEGMSFNLLEHLGHTIYEAFKEFTNGNQFKIIVHKVTPHYEQITNGMSFEYGDF